MELRPDTLERFYAKIDKTEYCWNWTAAICQGYGHFRIGKEIYSASRLSYEIHVGKIPEDIYVCHTCDNPKCVNPEHLFLGTPKDNMRDKIKKGRQGRGPALGRHKRKLNEDQVREIRLKYTQGGESRRELALQYNVALPTVEMIINRRSWKHI
jgi:hypothetical protein